MGAPYRFEARMNDGLIRLSHVKYGVQLWHSAKIRRTPNKKPRKCHACSEVLEPGTVAYRPLTFGENRMDRICEPCILAKEKGKVSSKENSETSGPCYGCEKKCGADYFCSGCKQFVCDECDIGFPMGHGHDPQAHLEEA